MLYNTNSQCQSWLSAKGVSCAPRAWSLQLTAHSAACSSAKGTGKAMALPAKSCIKAWSGFHTSWPRLKANLLCFRRVFRNCKIGKPCSIRDSLCSHPRSSKSSTLNTPVRPICLKIPLTCRCEVIIYKKNNRKHIWNVQEIIRQNKHSSQKTRPKAFCPFMTCSTTLSSSNLPSNFSSQCSSSTNALLGPLKRQPAASFLRSCDNLWIHKTVQTNAAKKGRKYEVCEWGKRRHQFRRKGL